METKEKRAEYWKRYYSKHRVAVLARRKLADQLNPGRAAAAQKKYRLKKSSVSKEWYKRNRVRRLAQQKLRRRKDPNFGRDATLRRLYGIDLVTYNQMVVEQRNCCAICEQPQPLHSKGLFVDHNHKTGVVRRLLCLKCNTGLGSYNDSIDLLTRAVEYLKLYDGK